MWTSLRYLMVLGLAVSGCATGASPAETTTIDPGATETTSAATTGDTATSTTAPATTTTAAFVPDLTLIAATCTALATERAPGREAALDIWDEAVTALPFAERTDPLEAECGLLLDNHQTAQSLLRRGADARSVGYRGSLSGCVEAPAEAVLANPNVFTIDALAIAQADTDGPGDGWGYSFEPGVFAEEERPVLIPWTAPRPGQACGLWTRYWLADTTSATATLHEPGDAPQDELPDTAPPLATTGDDWMVILTSLSRFQYWVEAHPDPALLEEYDDVRNGNFPEVHQELEDLASVDGRRVWDGFELISAEVIEEIDDRTVIVLYEQEGGLITEYAGDDIVAEDSVPRRSSLGVFRRSPFDERWRWLIRSFTVTAD